MQASAALTSLERLFDGVPDTVFFVKDAEGRYSAVNDTLAARLRAPSKSAILGKSARELFPEPLGSLIDGQDRAVLATGRPIRAKLELHLYPRGREGWCLTWKEPVLDATGRITGLTGISRDLASHPAAGEDHAGLSAILDHVAENLEKPLRLAELAQMAGLSAWQLDQRIRALFGISAGQYITRARIDAACARLRQTADPIAAIALDCGYGDQATFTRQFRKSVGMTPGKYRGREA